MYKNGAEVPDQPRPKPKNMKSKKGVVFIVL